MTGMTSMTMRQGHAAAFRRLHDLEAGAPLVLPNAWDAMSARVVEDAGARAIGTTSAGIAWALGRRDGQQVTRDEMLDVVRRIARSVRVPVTADIEGGYGSGTPEDVAETVRGAIGAGAVGINLEDSPGRAGEALLAVDAQCGRIAAARAAAIREGADTFINARIDVFLRQVGEPGMRLDETARRMRAFVEAGADGVFVPGVIDGPTIARLAAAAPAPLNVMAGPGAPTIAELGTLGVARVSVGPAMTLSVMAHARRAAAELLRDGTFEALREGLPFAEADRLFAGHEA
jgi:2-methylisocitrate lyase-like PEP mutase family enzyme